MSESMMRSSHGVELRNRRLGAGLAILAVLYVAAVILFIIFK
jgi:hypothetical protein